MKEKTAAVSLYREALIVYLDILGFSDLIDKSNSNPEIAIYILQALRIMQEQLYLDEQPFRTPDAVVKASFNTLNFSDLTIRATYLDGDLTWADALNHELFDLTVQQTSLVCEDILIRGAITMGKLYVDKGHVFGPALVRGYFLERDIAVFPRILIADELVNLSVQLDENVFGFFHQGDDGVWFLDYLYGYFMEALFSKARGKYSYADVMKRHKAVAENRLIEMSDKSEKIRQKAIWLALYHNGVVQRLRDYLKNPDSGHAKTDLDKGLDALRHMLIDLRLVQGLLVP